MALRDTEELFMTQALDLARQGVGLTSPNPCVGAIVVDERGRIAGRGTHTYEGRKHAEVLALEEAGDLAHGNTLYLNLEPCSHQGRTGPCADAIIAAGIARVVSAMRDPNPLVSGKGFEKLRAAGIEVVDGVLEAEARKLNESFTRYIRTRLPLVTLKTAMTLDGKIAAASNVSQNPTALGSAQASITYITGEAARAHVHKLRHASDAILVGVGTIIADDPLLTDRSSLPRRRPLLRVILDSRLRLPLESRLVKTCQEDVLVFCSFAEEKKRAELEARGVRVEQVPLATFEPQAGEVPYPHAVPTNSKPDMKKVFQQLGESEITSVLVEGGAAVNWTCLAAGVVDKIFFYYAPKILGGSGSVPFASGAGFARMAEAAMVHNITVHHFGEDFAIEGYLRDPYA
ncbi:MAG TPA: bifunctional diaminohydroxyphosphoribosylaminopyrimidine deaminase/5-amino-6-(5-phosphoribosylamino)uracil reductase RibD [Clostridia bacterium]|nr:bifunctional diaminohydroxyphosphoribosylaminopyrimidine deaminase/5-amino-6-(5-phosphoribosylamino)uracil reductase RibD [Clostridia bacterium]